MAKEKTLNDYILRELSRPVLLKDGTKAIDPIDGHELTRDEAIALNLVNMAMQGDLKAIDYCEMAKKRTKKNV